MKKRLLAVLSVLLLALAVDAQWAHVTTGTQRGGACDLCTDLVAYFPLDEVAGQRNDIKGANHLTDNNTVGSAAGKHNNAASFVAANNEYLSHASNADFRIPPTGRAFALWVYIPAGTPGDTIFRKMTDDFSADEYLLHKDGVDVGGAGQIYFVVLGGVGDWAIQSEAAPAPVPMGAWHLYVAWYDPSDKKAKLQIDNGVVAAGSALTTDPFNSASDFVLGKATVGWNGALQGQADEFAVWSVLDATRRTELWNAGAGKFYDGTQFAYLFWEQPWRYAKADWFLSRPPLSSVSLRDCPRTRASTNGGWR